MKTKTYLMLFVFLMVSIPRANAQAQELKQLALNIEKLSQFRAILRDMKKGYEILTEGYNTVKDLTEGNFNLHKTFLDKLLQVSPAVRNYKRVADIVEYQINLVQEYGRHKYRLTSSGLFNNNELAYFNNVYDKLVDDSLKDLDELTNVLTAGKLRMSDEERLEAIDRIYVSMQEKLLFLRDFNSDTTVLAIQRARETRDVEAIRLLTGTNH
jgi:DNA repair ATPase RecN